MKLGTIREAVLSERISTGKILTFDLTRNRFVKHHVNLSSQIKLSIREVGSSAVHANNNAQTFMHCSKRRARRKAYSYNKYQCST